MKKNKRQADTRKKFAALGIAPPRKLKKTGPDIVRDVRLFAWSIIKHHYAFLYRTYRDDVRGEIEIIAIMVERSGKTRRDDIKRIINAHLYNFLKENGWYRETRAPIGRQMDIPRRKRVRRWKHDQHMPEGFDVETHQDETQAENPEDD